MIFTNFKPYVHNDKSSFKIYLKTRKRPVLVTEEEKYLFVHNVVPENTQKKISHVENSKLFANIFFTRFAKYLWDNKHINLWFA